MFLIIAVMTLGYKFKKVQDYTPKIIEKTIKELQKPIVK
jgi:hypothetical protein